MEKGAGEGIQVGAHSSEYWEGSLSLAPALPVPVVIVVRFNIVCIC